MAPSVTIVQGGKAFTLSANGAGRRIEAAHSGNTYGEVFTSVEELDLRAGASELQLTFGPGPEEFNVHSGQWRLGEGRLSVVQVGTHWRTGTGTSRARSWRTATSTPTTSTRRRS